jgi:hypothetical protein
VKATLCIPRPAIGIDKYGAPRPLDEVADPEHTVNSKSVYHFQLRWTDHHPSSHYGIGVLLDSKGEVVDGFFFRFLRDRLGAWIESDDPGRLASALGVPPDEAGIK